MRACKVLLLVVGLLMLGAEAGWAEVRPPAPVYRQCGNVTITLGEGEGAAARIRSTNVSCARAREVAARCIRGSSRGWLLSTEPRLVREGGDRTHLDRGRATISFNLVGGGGCE
jgi:hypothetical protein